MFFNPATEIKSPLIAMFKPRDHSLQSEYIGAYFQSMDNVGAMATMKLTRNSYCILWFAQVNKQ
ncbi:hypothetical protein CRI66_07190 [Escherichia sp. E4694]|nr:hypothetical protein CRI66_07190 [Escherichia sp. E4694]